MPRCIIDAAQPLPVFRQVAQCSFSESNARTRSTFLCEPDTLDFVREPCFRLLLTDSSETGVDAFSVDLLVDDLVSIGIAGDATRSGLAHTLVFPFSTTGRPSPMKSSRTAGPGSSALPSNSCSSLAARVSKSSRRMARACLESFIIGQ